MDSYGDVTIEWDSVSNASSYDIYFNNAIIDSVSASKSKYILLASEITSARDFNLGVRAISKTSTVKDSEIAYATFKYIKEKIDIPNSLYASNDTVDMLYRIDPIGVDDNKVIAVVTVMLDGSVVPNFQIARSVKTNRLGVAEVAYDREKGLEMAAIFDSVGEYTIKISIENKSGLIQMETFDINVRNRSGSGSGSSGVIRIENLNFVADSNWYRGATLTFKLSQDLNLRDGESDLVVEFEWSVRDGAEGIITLYATDITNATRIYAGDLVEITLNSNTSGARVITKEIDKGSKVYISANVYVTDKYGTSREANSRSVIYEN